MKKKLIKCFFCFNVIVVFFASSVVGPFSSIVLFPT